MDTESSAESELTEELLRDAGRKIEELLEKSLAAIELAASKVESV